MPWKLMSIADLPYRTTIWGNAVDIGAIGVGAIGLMWRITGAAFVFLAVAVVVDAAWWYPVLLPTAAVSTIACVVEWPQARAGVLANAVVSVLAVAVHAQASGQVQWSP